MPPKKKTPLIVTNNFKLVFIAVLGLTLLPFLVAVLYSAVVHNPNEVQSKVINWSLDISKMGVGAILELLGGSKFK